MPDVVTMVRRLRLGSGLVLAVYVTVHLCNHALGVVSIDAQEAMRQVVSPLWRSVPGTVLLYTALIGHSLLGLYALWRRETLRMPFWELAQLSLGLAIPLMLIPHVFATRIAASMLAYESTYRHVVAALWAKDESLLRQTLLLLIVWSHVALGLHYWLRLRPGYRRLLPLAVLFAVVVPMLALLGFRETGVELARTTRTGGDAASYGDYGSYGAAEGSGDYAATAGRTTAFESRKDRALALAGGSIAFVLLARIVRRGLRSRGKKYEIHHANGEVVLAPIGQSLLEALREARIPHASVCGGRARCTTCRVRVGLPRETLPVPNDAEASALRRIHADPDTRLACQLRPTRAVFVTPLVAAHAGPAAANAVGSEGRERSLAVMFVDVRDSSRIAEDRLPYDVLFILNRFFAEMVEALVETGGYYANFNGDGFMALYGTQTDLAEACRAALRGTVALGERLRRINAALASELRHPLRVAIGLHAGEAIFGSMGPPVRPIVSALGDTVNVAARLEAEAKRHDCALVVSEPCARASGVDLSAFPQHTVNVRGRSQPVSYYAIADMETLARMLSTPERSSLAAS